eukprot:ANDGO_01915.mRNA.1 Peroxisomal ATPase PEX1
MSFRTSKQLSFRVNVHTVLPSSGTSAITLTREVAEHLQAFHGIPMLVFALHPKTKVLESRPIYVQFHWNITQHVEVSAHHFCESESGSVPSAFWGSISLLLDMDLRTVQPFVPEIAESVVLVPDSTQDADLLNTTSAQELEAVNWHSISSIVYPDQRLRVLGIQFRVKVPHVLRRMGANCEISIELKKHRDPFGLLTPALHQLSPWHSIAKDGADGAGDAATEEEDSDSLDLPLEVSLFPVLPLPFFEEFLRDVADGRLFFCRENVFEFELPMDSLKRQAIVANVIRKAKRAGFVMQRSSVTDLVFYLQPSFLSRIGVCAASAAPSVWMNVRLRQLPSDDVDGGDRCSGDDDDVLAGEGRGEQRSTADHPVRFHLYRDVCETLIDEIMAPFVCEALTRLMKPPCALGYLFFGPSGFGKSYIAKQMCQLVHQRGGSFLFIRGPEFLSKFTGQSESNLRSIFERARSSSRRPCVLVLDEVDSIAPVRGHDSSGVTDRIVNTLLTELDGIENRDGVVVIGTTSRKEAIDPAVLRPGRLEQHVFFGPPLRESEISPWLCAIDAQITAEMLDREVFPYFRESTDGWNPSPADWLSMVSSWQYGKQWKDVVREATRGGHHLMSGKKREQVSMA